MLTSLVAALVALPPLYPIAELRGGERGECHTVFEGDLVEPFPFVVKDVMPNFLGPGRNLVLIRLEGEKAEFTGVVAGMSGSPCFIGAKLVGALGYAFANFAKEPIAGVTPMADMLDVMRLPDQSRPWRLSTASADDWQAIEQGRALASAPAPASDLRPIATPLTIGGVVPRVRERFTPYLESLGFMVMAGGSGGAGSRAPKTLTPGSAIAALLVSGDVDIAATGTVTSVEGDQILAFGHPFLGVGAVSVPMATARIHNTMASLQRSFKMSAPGTIVGELTQDRLTAIGGILGRKSRMIPVRGKVRLPLGEVPFSFDVARDPVLSPRFVAMGLANALYGRVDIGDRGTVRLQAEVRAKDLPSIKVRNVFSGERDGGLFTYAAVEVARNLASLWDTPFGPPPDMEVTFTAEQDSDPFEEYIEVIHVDRGIAKPGDNVEVAVRLRRNKGPVTFERFSLQVPRSWAGQTIDLLAASAEAAEGVAGIVEGDPRPTDLPQIARFLNDRRTDGQVYFMALREGDGMRVRVDAMPMVPGSAVATHSGSPETQRTAGALAWEERRARPGVVYGGARTSLKVMSAVMSASE